jgi:hypothetical protein
LQLHVCSVAKLTQQKSIFTSCRYGLGCVSPASAHRLGRLAQNDGSVLDYYVCHSAFIQTSLGQQGFWQDHPSAVTDIANCDLHSVLMKL